MPPGIGKSRIVDETVAAAREADPDITLLVGRGEASRRFTGWHAIASAIRERASLSEDTEPAEALSALSELASEADAGEYCGAFLAAACGFALPEALSQVVDNARQDPRVMRDQIVNAVGELIEGLAQQSPVILVIRDVQWADVPSLELLDVLFRRLDRSPLFVLLTGRPYAVEERPELFDVPQLEHRTVKELSAKASRKLLESVLTARAVDLEESLVEDLVEHTGGNPFFITEVARYVADRIEKWGPEAFDPAAYALPLTVEAAVQSRLDHLDRLDKDLLKRASIFGDRFWRESLPDLGCPDPAPSLTRLSRARLVRRPSRRDTQLAGHE